MIMFFVHPFKNCSGKPSRILTIAHALLVASNFVIVPFALLGITVYWHNHHTEFVNVYLTAFHFINVVNLLNILMIIDPIQFLLAAFEAGAET